LTICAGVFKAARVEGAFDLWFGALTSGDNRERHQCIFGTGQLPLLAVMPPPQQRTLAEEIIRQLESGP